MENKVADVQTGVHIGIVSLQPMDPKRILQRYQPGSIQTNVKMCKYA